MCRIFIFSSMVEKYCVGIISHDNRNMLNDMEQLLHVYKWSFALSTVSFDYTTLQPNDVNQ